MSCFQSSRFLISFTLSQNFLYELLPHCIALLKMFGAKLISKTLPFNNRDSSVYAALRGGSEDDSSLPSEKDFEEPVFARKRSSKSGKVFSCAVILLLVSTNILTFTGLLATKHLLGEKGAAEPEYTPKSAGMPCTLIDLYRDSDNPPARVETIPTQWKRLSWWTEYSDKNFTETDALWDDINPAHGFIAMDREWAKSKHWPDSMHLPSDDSKNVYLLEAYHLIHCVVSRMFE